MEGGKQGRVLPTIRLKRVYEVPGEEDGFRILVDRLWPRGVSREKARISLWVKDLAPSTGLRTWYHREPGKWDEFEGKYFRELDGCAEAVELLLKEIGGRGQVTFVYSSKNEERNNALALKDYLLKKF